MLASVPLTSCFGCVQVSMSADNGCAPSLSSADFECEKRQLADADIMVDPIA
jgi:hypothetical protein